MYLDFPGAQKPSDDSTIWRYIDFTKFVAMLEDKALFFCRADLLRDPFEGFLPPSTIDFHFPTDVEKKVVSQSNKDRKMVAKIARQNVFVNCWHANEHESAAMWRLYSDEGVAIRSTFGRLKASLGASHQLVQAGMVAYIDHDAAPLPLDNVVVPCLFKRKSFAHECELRAMYWDTVEVSRQFQAYKKDGTLSEPSKKGLKIPVDLDSLIDRVYVSPTKQEWFSGLVKAMLMRFGYNKNVNKSALADVPIW